MNIEYATLSKQILDGCLSTKPGQRVWIHSRDHTLELASNLALESRKRRLEVLLTVQLEDLWLRSMTEARLELLDNLPAHVAAASGETQPYSFPLGRRKPMRWDKTPAHCRG